MASACVEVSSETTKARCTMVPPATSAVRKSILAATPSKTLKRQRSETAEAPVASPARRRITMDAASTRPVEIHNSLLKSLEDLDLPAIVVNLARRPDRWVGCLDRLETGCPGLKFSRFDASDGCRDEISTAEATLEWDTSNNVKYQKLRSIRKGWNDLDSYKEKQLTLSAGERGCSLSHIRAWRHCLAECCGTDRPLLVLEDDAAPTPEFVPVLRRVLAALPGDAHVLYLGYSQAAEWTKQVTPELVKSEYVWTTVGYIVWPAGARIMLSRLPVDQPVDNWMANLSANGHLNSYCVRPKIILQADEWNVNSDVGHSDESDIHKSDHLYWGNTEAAVNAERLKASKTEIPRFWDMSSDEESAEAADQS